MSISNNHVPPGPYATLFFVSSRWRQRNNCAPDPPMGEVGLKIELAPTQDPCSFLPWIQTKCAGGKRGPDQHGLPRMSFPQ